MAITPTKVIAMQKGGRNVLRARSSLWARFTGPFSVLTPLMARLDVANRARAGAHHDGRGECTPTEILHAVKQITSSDACGGKGYIVALDEVIGAENLIEIDAVTFEF